MSQENVELVERAIAALNARHVAAYIACCAADMTLETPLAVVGGAYEGSDGIRRFFNDIEEAAPDVRIEVERTQEVDPMCVIAFVRTSSTGARAAFPSQRLRPMSMRSSTARSAAFGSSSIETRQ